MIGQIKESKGQLIAIEAFKKLLNKYLNNELIIVGSGTNEDINEVKKEIASESNIILKPFSRNVGSYYEISHIYLMCSEYEAFGRVTIEAMAHGLAVIGNNEGATKEIIENYKTGIFYDGTVHDLYLKMEYLLKNSENRMKIGGNASKSVKKKFNKELYIENIYKLLNSY